MEDRLTVNIPSISENEQQMLLNSRVFVAGCGGLGGSICEHLARLGVGAVSAADDDCFQASNINRQLGADISSLGQSKVLIARERAMSIAPDMRFEALSVRLNDDNAQSLIHGHDLVFDALDSIASRLALERACAELGIPLIHGAVSGWTLQAAVVPPGGFMLRRIYENAKEPNTSSVLSFTPACCAAIQCAQATALLTGRDCELYGKLLCADLLSMQQHIFEI